MATTAACYSYRIFALQDIDLFSIVVSLTSHVNIAWMEVVNICYLMATC